MKEYEYYYFDFDGTLVYSLPSLVAPFQKAFSLIGLSLSEDDVRELTHMAFVQMCEKFHVKDEKMMLDIYNVMNSEMHKDEEIAKIVIFPESEKVLKTLKEKGKKIAIVSGNHTAYIKRVMNIHHLENYFDFYVGGDSVPLPKPYADPLNKARELSGNPDRKDCIYIGDSLQDPECAKNAGIDGILVDRRHEYSDYKDTKIYSLEELIDAK